jgi:hypothetical protein
MMCGTFLGPADAPPSGVIPRITKPESRLLAQFFELDAESTIPPTRGGVDRHPEMKFDMY